LGKGKGKNWIIEKKATPQQRGGTMEKKTRVTIFVITNPVVTGP